ncbi:MAG: hypothetical protein WCR46_21930 [Deltaproteobacteria bacterium]|jgi:multidrug efflux pump subunit AcrA (membrane-fusion protein)
MTTDPTSEPNTPDASEPDRATKEQHHAWWLVVIPVVILALGVYLFQSKRVPAAELGTKPKLPGIPVSVALARKADVSVYISGLGSVIPISPKTSVFVIGDEFSNANSSNPYQNKFWLTN